MADVKISEALFMSLCRYHLLYDDSQASFIRDGLEKKVEALSRRSDYTAYKEAASPEEREAARLRYLDRIGMKDEWRW